jgi:hypothetical protein
MEPFYFDEIVQLLQLSLGTTRNIPNAQGFYLIFDIYGHPIYVGSGNLHDRVLSHFDPRNASSGDYIAEGVLYIYFVTRDEEYARAFEGAIYREYNRETGHTMRHNERTPPGSSLLKSIGAILGWRNVIENIQQQRYEYRCTVRLGKQ